MPELPEVETIRRELEAEVVGRRITAITLYEPRVVKHPEPEVFVSQLRGKTLDRVDRKAKYLIIRLSGGWFWVVHLMLEGQFLYLPADSPVDNVTKLAVQLDNGCQLRLRDVVGLAKTLLLREGELTSELKLDELGPEPIDPAFTFETFLSRLKGRSGMVKPLLMDQHVLSGVGNLYADEALFRARIHPKRKANTLSREELRQLYQAIIEVIREGIEHQGTTARGSLYRDIWGREGGHQAHLQVFRKAGEPCPGCPGTIERTTVGGRSTFYCPSCQK